MNLELEKDWGKCFDYRPALKRDHLSLAPHQRAASSRIRNPA
jgi:hypothetical protein